MLAEVQSGLLGYTNVPAKRQLYFLFQTAKFMNTYKLESENPFNVDKVEKILKEVLIEALDNLTYDPDKVPKQAKWASSVIRAKVKEQEYDRYVLFSNIAISNFLSHAV